MDGSFSGDGWEWDNDGPSLPPQLKKELSGEGRALYVQQFSDAPFHHRPHAFDPFDAIPASRGPVDPFDATVDPFGGNVDHGRGGETKADGVGTGTTGTDFDPFDADDVETGTSTGFGDIEASVALVDRRLAYDGIGGQQRDDGSSDDASTSGEEDQEADPEAGRAARGGRSGGGWSMLRGFKRAVTQKNVRRLVKKGIRRGGRRLRSAARTA